MKNANGKYNGYLGVDYFKNRKEILLDFKNMIIMVKYDNNGRIRKNNKVQFLYNRQDSPNAYLLLL